jgi:hypothetical protein
MANEIDVVGWSRFAGPPAGEPAASARIRCTFTEHGPKRVNVLNAV